MKRCQSREPGALGPGEQCILSAGHARVALHVGKSGAALGTADLVGIATKRRGGTITIDERLANLEGAAWRRRA